MKMKWWGVRLRLVLLLAVSLGWFYGWYPYVTLKMEAGQACYFAMETLFLHGILLTFVFLTPSER